MERVVVSNVHGVIKECDTIDTCLYVDFIRCVTCRQKVFGIAGNHVYGKYTFTVVHRYACCSQNLA